MEPENLITVLFGGREKLDCWITQAADLLADPKLLKPVVFTSVPESFRELVNHPKEALDLMLERLDDLGIWGYTIKMKDGLAEVTDDLTGHVLETAPVAEWPQIHALADKYGQNVRVVQD